MNSIKTAILGLLLATGILSSGCATTEPSRADILVKHLNTSSSENMAARMELKELGNEAVPSLLREMDRSASHLRDENNALAAVRAMRVVRGIDTAAALPACRRILTEEYLPPKTKYDCALLNEALEVLYDQFDTREARDIFCEFVASGPSRYARKIREARHWENAVYIPRVQVDVLRGLRMLASSRDRRATDALASFIAGTDIGSLRRTYYHRLSENGYGITESATGSTARELAILARKNEKNQGQ